MKSLIKTHKKLNAFWVISQAILALFIGIFIFNKESIFLNIFEYIVAIYFLVMGIIELFKSVISRKGKKVKLAGVLFALINILISVLIAKNPGYMLYAFSIIFSIYIVVTAIAKTIALVIYLKNKIKGRVIMLGQALLTYVFSVVLWLSQSFRDNLVIVLAGTYFIALAITYMLDVIEILMPVKYKKILRRRIRIVLPVLIASFIPKTSLRKLEQSANIDSKEALQNVYDSEQVDMEIMIHIRNRGKEIFGHADIFFDGKILAYGPYDKTTNIIQNLIGDGVLLETSKKQEYIDICMKYNSMTIVSFGIKLTEEQKQVVRSRIEEIKKDVYSWKCKAENGIKSRDYASVVYEKTDAKFFKFKQGKFRKYFSFNTNCVLFMDKIIGGFGISIVRLTGIITPGTYYDYFNRQYKLQNSNVIYKKVYKYEKIRNG